MDVIPGLDPGIHAVFEGLTQGAVRATNRLEFGPGGPFSVLRTRGFGDASSRSLSACQRNLKGKGGRVSNVFKGNRDDKAH